MTRPTTLTSALMSLPTALVCQSTAVMPVISPVSLVVLVLIGVIAQLVPVMSAVLAGISEAMPVILRLMTFVGRMVCLSKIVVIGPIAMVTEPNRGSKYPPILLG